MTELLSFTKPHVLRSEAEYDAAVEEIDRLLDANPRAGTEEYERLEFLSVLVSAYEDAHLPEESRPTPQQAVEFMLEQRGMTRVDLAPWLGGRSRVSEFLSGKRRLSLGQVESLRANLGVPADLLIEERSDKRTTP